MKRLVVCLAVCAAPALGQGDAAFYLASGGGLGDVVVGVGGAPSPVAGLSGVRLLPIDHSLRSNLTELLPDRPRRKRDVPNASRLVLPAGRGSLYRYERPHGGGVAFGYFLVEASGVVTGLLERDGTGTLGDVDPFVPRVGVAPDGAALLVATTVAAGGDLLEVDVATGAVVDRTASLAPEAFADGGLALQASWGIAVSDTGVWRFDRTVGAEAGAVALPDAPAWIAPDLAVAEGGGFAAVIAGTGPTAAHAYVLAPTGAAVRATAAPAYLARVGYLPEDAYGPYLAVSPDGTRCAYVTERLVPDDPREAWVVRVDAPGVDEQITKDGVYEDTLDEVGLIGFLKGPVVTYAVGEVDDVLLGGMDGIDLYQATLPAVGGPDIVNLTQTGTTQPPFAASELGIESGLFALPGGRIVFHGRDENTESLLALDPGQAGATVLVPNIKELFAIERSGDGLLVSLEHSKPNKTTDLYRIGVQPGAPATQVAVFPEDTLVDRLVSRGDGMVGLVISAGTAQFLARVDTLTGAPGLVVPFPFTYGPALGFAANGELTFTAGPASVVTIGVAWPDAGPFLPILLKGSPGHLLPAS